ncbi:acyl-CoA dehydrogenase family protein [Peredibacter sp. HCB2-198]|uniref:acyl-CoA dehydrogenase family protein n=1 Tax=Peredibacter sp. HCB2-198 TaxID=3383025 RepID=UPI0038B496D4
MDFYQVPPSIGNQYSEDHVLQAILKRQLPEKVFKEIEPELKRFGERVITELEPLAQEAEANPPVHVPYDPWGKRIDHIKVTKAWDRLHEIASEEGIVATGYERKNGEYSRLHQFAKLYLYHPSSAIYSCPLAMTDGAARVIELYGSPEMKKKAYVNLLSRDPKTFWTSGQWMTERTGGSDVSGTSTVAKKVGDHYELHGVKWFTSATTSQMAMTLARIEGEEKLSMFYVELRNAQGELQNIRINRLKDKLGTKALPTAELTLDGTPALLVGEPGKGVKTIATLFNITRLYNACCSVGYMHRGISLSLDYAKKRKAFGKMIIDHGLHLETMADLQVRFEACLQMTFHAAVLLGKEEMGKTTEIESGTLRLLIPLVKLFTAKEGVAISSEVIESFGGAGYVEDTGLPQLLRNAQVLSIWEGTTNVLSLDALRAIKKENAAPAFLKDIELRLGNVKHPELQGMKEKVMKALGHIQKVFADASKLTEEDLNTKARSLAMGLSRTYNASLMIEHAEWGLKNNDQSGFVSAKRWMEQELVHLEIAGEERRKESQTILRTGTVQ